MKRILGTMLAAFICFLSGCDRPFDNPVDAAGTVYQGYVSVTDLSGVAPQLPVNGGTLSWPILTCAQCTEADLYRFQVADSEAGLDTAPLLDKQDSAANIWKLDASANLTTGTKYYWRVKARSKTDNTNWGAWSAVFTFTPGSAITGVTPADGGTASNGVLGWSAVDGASRYDLQYAFPAADVSTAAVQSVTATSYTMPDTLNSGAVLYWRVRPVKSDETSGFWSPPVSA